MILCFSSSIASGPAHQTHYKTVTTRAEPVEAGNTRDTYKDFPRSIRTYIIKSHQTTFTLQIHTD